MYCSKKLKSMVVKKHNYTVRVANKNCNVKLKKNRLLFDNRYFKKKILVLVEKLSSLNKNMKKRV